MAVSSADYRRTAGAQIDGTAPVVISLRRSPGTGSADRAARDILCATSSGWSRVIPRFLRTISQGDGKWFAAQAQVARDIGLRS